MKKVILYTTATTILFLGCAGSNESASWIASSIGKQPGVTYTTAKMNNPLRAEVIRVQGKEIKLSEQAMIVYGAAGVVAQKLEQSDPKDFPSNMPGQIVWVRMQDHKEANVTYKLDMTNPYTFRVRDEVIVDYNGTDIIGIRAFGEIK